MEQTLLHIRSYLSVYSDEGSILFAFSLIRSNSSKLETIAYGVVLGVDHGVVLGVANGVGYRVANKVDHGVANGVDYRVAYE